GQGDELTKILWSVYLLAAVCLTIGLFTRASSCIVWVLLVSFQNRNPFILHTGDLLLQLCGFLLIFAPAGAMYSVDSWMQRKWFGKPSQKLFEPWAQRLLQLFMCIMYFECSLTKLTSPYWWNGASVYYAVHSEDFRRFWIPYVFDHLWTCQLIAWFTM